ncbi:hypothetical protein BHE74_00047761, partial [Ensete ventricosum]
AVEGQRYTKNTAVISSVRTLADSKLGVISIGDRPPWNSIGDRPPWNSIGIPPSLVFCYMS